MCEFDIVIKNGRIIDGTGNPWFKRDIGIGEGKIKEIGSVKRGETIIDAEGMVVSPGFIDIHNHSDFTILAYPNAESYIMQGVTTAVVGNCGASMAPVNPENLELLKRYLSPFLVHGFNYGWNWRTLGEYYKKVEEKGVSMNLAPLVGHGTIRIAVKGFDASDPSEEEMSEMKRLLVEALKDGAYGLSSGLIYPPGAYAKTKELIELAKVVAEYGGVYASHIRSESDTLIEAVSEAIDIGKKSGIPVEISHHKAAGRGNWGKVNATLRMMEQAREDGVEVNCDVYPYTAGSTTITSLLPTWVLEGGTEKMMERLRDKKTRERIRREFLEDRIRGENWIKSAGLDGILISSCPPNTKYEGKNLEDILKEKNMLDKPYEGVFDFILEIRGEATIVIFAMSEEDLSTVISNPLSSICSDSWLTRPSAGGKPHPRVYGTFPRVLGKYVRQNGLIRIEEAIRKMTSLPATKIGLKNRGLIKEGFQADIVVFDPAHIIDKATYEDPHKYPEGINYVIVNGKVVVENGNHTGARPGKILRRKR